MNKKIMSIFFVGALCLSPITVQASTTYATSEDGTKNYTSIDSAWNAAESGVKIVMQQDWNISSRLVLDSDKTATIEMNGHKISRNLSDSKTNGEVIKLCSNSTLNLNGKNASKTKFSFKGYNTDGNYIDVSTTSGGLITGGYSSNGGGGIHMKAGSKLNLDTVSISGNKAERSWLSDGHGGGICMDGSGDKLTMNNAEITFNASQRHGGGVYVNNKNSSIEMNNNSLITENSAGANIEGLDADDASGGGISIDGENVTVTLNSGSGVNDNYSQGFGGGIYSSSQGTKVYLNASSVNLNLSENTGSGLYFYYSKFEVSSENNDGEISHNIAKNAYGGGIYAARCVFTGNNAKIKGITFDGNSCKEGGAININQEDVTVSDCTFVNNKAEDGGAIMINNDEFTLENSTVQNNTTTSASSAAVMISCYNDFTLSGTVNITNNTNSALNYDSDLLLETLDGSEAYILTTPNASSRIGLFIDKPRTVAKNQTSDALNIYYVNNLDEYEISYDENTKEITSKTNSGESTNNSTQVSSHTLIINMVNESGTWQNTQKMSINDNEALELQAPLVEDKTFTEFKDVPESLTVENDVVKADSVLEDLELTLVYSDPESEESTGSIFGDGNTAIVAVIVIGIIAVGVFIYKKKKAKD